MSNITLTYNENDLFKYVQMLRLATAKRLNESQIKENEKISENKPTFKVTVTNALRLIKRGVGNYENKSEDINKQIALFNKNNPSVIDESAARWLALSLFEDDKYGLRKLLFAVTIILDNEYKYLYSEKGLEEASNVLYGNNFELATIKKQVERNYKAISPNGLSSLQKGALLGAAMAALVGVITMPVLLGARIGASAAATTAALAAHGFGDMQMGLAVITAESLLIGAALTGITYGGMKLYNNSLVKKEFRSLTPEKNALYLAIQCTYIEKVKVILSEEEFKEQLDNILKNLNVLKGDLDYYLFVEKEAINDNKSKIKSFHEFDNQLAKVLCM